MVGVTCVAIFPIITIISTVPALSEGFLLLSCLMVTACIMGGVLLIKSAKEIDLLRDGIDERLW